MQLKILELPVKYNHVDPEEFDKYEDMGIEPPEDIRDGILKVNVPYGISAWNRDTEGEVALRLNTGETWKVFMPIEEFERLLTEL